MMMGLGDKTKQRPNAIFTRKRAMIRIVCRYQRGNENPYIEEEQITQQPNEKVQKDKQRSTKHTYKIRISRKNRQHNGQTKKYKRTNNDLQN